MRPKSTISTPKVDDEHPHHFHTSFHCWERGCPSGNIESNLDITILYNENLSLGPGSAVGEKGKKRGQIGKYRGAKLAERYPGEEERAPPFPPPQATYRLASLHNFFFFVHADFSPFSHNAEPGPRLRRPRYKETSL